MIDSASSTESNRFVTIQEPLPTISYSWSDVPIVVQKDFATIPQSTSLSYKRNFSKHSPFCSSHSPCQDFSTSSERIHEVCKSTANTSSNDSSSRSSTAKKNVRFAPLPNIRIYSLVLGDHPKCDDGLAIELGWDYCDDESHNRVYGKHTGKNTGKRCQKRPYLTRKQLLLDVAGCTYEELDQRSRDVEARNSLNKQSRTNQENNYYQLATSARRLMRYL